jgi:hypothetical protein
MSTPPSETDLLRALQLDATQRGLRLFRNNCGAFRKPDGAVLRYGVGSPGGSDLIGWTPHVVTATDVGRTLAVFTSVEGKRLPRRPTVDQMRFLEAVDAAGGLTCVAYHVDDLAVMLKLRR